MLKVRVLGLRCGISLRRCAFANMINSALVSLEGKNAIITGASRTIGIGAATARAFAKAGANVLFTTYAPYDKEVHQHEVDEAEDLLKQLRGHGVEAHRLELDLSQPGAANELFNDAQKQLGQIDILVNNATYSTRGGVFELTAEMLDKHYAVNVRGTALLCAEFAKRFQGKAGRIINLTSGQGLTPMPDELAYVATKGAVEALTLSLSAGLASRNITVNAVDPGITNTGWMTSEFKSEMTRAAPMGRVGTPEDAARLILFLASDEAQWVTGQVVRSRGGM